LQQEDGAMSNAGDSSRRAKRPAKNTPTGNYEVGFCKPPRANQFKPGNNANPMGRPKGMRNRKVVVKALLLEPIPVREGTTVKTMSKIEAILTQTINDALKGDHKSRLMAIAMAREDGLLTPEQVEAIEENMSEHDKKIMENFKTRFAPQSALQTAANIVGQMGMSAFQRALAAGIDVVIAGRACDTAIFAALPAMTGFPIGPAMHMAKIIECASLCCVPGGRDAILATLDHEGFELDSMARQRRATPVSVAAHSLYEQSDPFTIYEPEGRVDLAHATYHAIDNRRTRVVGARWEGAKEPWVKIEGARKVGERAVLLCGTADPKFIAQQNKLLKEVEIVVRDLVCEDTPEDYLLTWRVYGVQGVRMTPPVAETLPPEAFIMSECIAPTRERAAEVVRTTKQYLLHHGYEGRLSTGGNLAFPFTPPEVSIGPAYRFNIYHLMRTADLSGLFPLDIETL